MASNYKIGGVDFPIDPLNKTWQKTLRGTNGLGGKVTSGRRKMMLTMPIMDVTDANWFLSKFETQTSLSTFDLPDYSDPTIYTTYNGFIENINVNYMDIDATTLAEQWVRDMSITISVIE